jgi:pentatricopeptide repeat protein
MEGMKSGRERREVLEEMRDAGVEPDVVTFTTIIQGFVADFDAASALSAFNEMSSCRVQPNQHTLSSLFSALVRGLNGDVQSGLLKIIEIFQMHVPANNDHKLLDHFVAGPVLRALASCCSVADLDAFWSRCQRSLARSHDGWPGAFLAKQMRDLYSRSLSRTAGWERLVELCSDACGGGGCAAAHAVCKNWQQYGSCRFGDGCNFKDGHAGAPGGSDSSSRVEVESFRAPMPRAAGRSVVCNNWERDGSCRFGDACLYKEGHAVAGSSGGRSGGAARAIVAHAPTAAAPHRGAVVCNNWQQRGSCQFGDACRYKDGHKK